MYRITSPRPSHRINARAADTTPAPRTHVRTLVSTKTMSVLRQLPWVKAAADRYLLQPPAQCVDHTDRLQDLLIRSLCTQGHLQLTPSPDEAAGGAAPLEEGDERWRIRPYAAPTPFPCTEDDRLAPRVEVKRHPDAAFIADLIATHGPVTITPHGALAPDQGGEDYTEHHALLVLQTFMHGGRHIAVVLDGNNRQQNEIMDAVRQHAADLGLRAEDLSVSELRDAQRLLPAHLQIDQLPFRLIDLDGLLEVSARQHADRNQATGSGTPSAKQPYPDTVRWVSNARVVGNPLPPAAADALHALCDEPGAVERFDDVAPSSIRRDE